MLIENIQPSAVRDQSPGSGLLMPSNLVIGRLNVENA